MKQLLFFIVLIITSISINAQNIKWVKEVKATHAWSGGQILTDLQGNAYGVGGFTGTLTLASSISMQQGSAHLPGYTCGIDTANGNATWASEIRPVAGCGCNYGDQGSVFEFDHSGNFIVAGYFCNCGTMAFGTQTLSALSHQTYLAKYNETGQLLWVKTKADINNGMTVADNFINAITTDEFDNIYLSIGSGLAANFAGINIGKGSYLMKLNASGNAIWSKQNYNGTAPYNGLSVRQLKYLNNKLYASSLFMGNITIDGHSFSSLNSTVDAAILKLDTAGILLNKLIINSLEEDYEFNLQILPNASIIYIGQAYNVSGTSSALISAGTNTFNTINTQSKYYFVKLDTSLTITAIKNLNQNLQPRYLKHDLNNNIYLQVGNSLASNTFDGAVMQNTGYHIIKMDDNLNGLNALQTMILGFSVDKDANIYVASPTTSTTVSGFGTSFTPVGSEPYSQFLIKLGPMVATGIDNNGNRTSNAQIYPNPSATGLYNLKIGENIKQKNGIQITITNTLGQAFNNITYTMENNQTIQVNLATLASGLYNITAIIDGKSYSAKLEKE